MVKKNRVSVCRHVIMVCLLLILVGGTNRLAAQDVERPSIWVKPSDRASILKKIDENEWAANYYRDLQVRTDDDVDDYLKNPKAYLSKLPLAWANAKSGQVPAFIPILEFNKESETGRHVLMHYLQTGIDCGVLYFLTNEEKYADYGSAVLNAFIQAILPLPTSKDIMNGGWLYPNDHLREAREIGAQVPILYDFVAPYIIKKALVYDLVTTSKKTFSIENAEKVFRTYATLAIEHGIIDCNWPVFESSSLIGNALALHDEQERNQLMKNFLEKSTAHQDALPKMVREYTDHQGNWPESINYASGATSYIAYLMTLLSKYDTTLHLLHKYPEPLLALPTPYYLTYPNKTETIIYGDAHRSYHENYAGFEMAYALGKLEVDEKIVKLFGSLINTAIDNGAYQRDGLGEQTYQASVYKDPTHLLWSSGVIEGEKKAYTLPTTFQLPYAGIFIQRNFSSTGNAKDDLMGFVGGGHFVHGHASGMNMELYGKGHVLGVKAGRSNYRTDIHENYYRIFAGHNTVIVNGASQGEGGWANLEINQVQEVAIEPKPWDKGVSVNNSFSITHFVDDKGDDAEAVQERTLAIVRTSPTTGYYIDVFKSKSEKENQYHDYVYHNIGETLTFNQGLNLHADENRFQASASKEWINNRKARNPGWHFFEKVQSSDVYANNVAAVFQANKLGPEPVNMKLFIPGNNGREYTKVMAPPASEAHAPYDKKPNPTLVIRQHGEAWSKPFAVVFEPTTGKSESGSIQSVESIIQNEIFKGLIIKSKVDDKQIIQYALILESDDATFEDKKLGISFTGRYAVVTLNDKSKIQSLYIGEGSSFSFRNVTVSTIDKKDGAGYITFEGKKFVADSDTKMDVKFK